MMGPVTDSKKFVVMRVRIVGILLARNGRANRQSELLVEGEGLWTTYSSIFSPWNVEAAKGNAEAVKFQVRPDPLGISQP